MIIMFFSLDASPNLTHSFNLTYRTTLTENITFKETWQDLPDKIRIIKVSQVLILLC